MSVDVRTARRRAGAAVDAERVFCESLRPRSRSTAVIHTPGSVTFVDRDGSADSTSGRSFAPDADLVHLAHGAATRRAQSDACSTRGSAPDRSAHAAARAPE